MMSVGPVNVVAPVAECTLTSTPAVPLNVTFWPLAPSGKTGLSSLFPLMGGTVESNWTTNQSHVCCSPTPPLIELATPVLPTEESDQAETRSMVPSEVSKLTG